MASHMTWTHWTCLGSLKWYFKLTMTGFLPPAMTLEPPTPLWGVFGQTPQNIFSLVTPYRNYHQFILRSPQKKYCPHSVSLRIVLILYPSENVEKEKRIHNTLIIRTIVLTTPLWLVFNPSENSQEIASPSEALIYRGEGKEWNGPINVPTQ